MYINHVHYEGSLGILPPSAEDIKTAPNARPEGDSSGSPRLLHLNRTASLPPALRPTWTFFVADNHKGGR